VETAIVCLCSTMQKANRIAMRHGSSLPSNDVNGIRAKTVVASVTLDVPRLEIHILRDNSCRAIDSPSRAPNCSDCERYRKRQFMPLAIAQAQELYVCV